MTYMKYIMYMERPILIICIQKLSKTVGTNKKDLFAR